MTSAHVKLMFSSYRNQWKYLIRKSIDYQVSIWWQHWFLMSRLDLVYSSLSRISAEERCGAVLPRHLISRLYIRAQFSRTTKSSLINELRHLKVTEVALPIMLMLTKFHTSLLSYRYSSQQHHFNNILGAFSQW